MPNYLPNDPNERCLALARLVDEGLIAPEHIMGLALASHAVDCSAEQLESAIRKDAAAENRERKVSALRELLERPLGKP